MQYQSFQFENKPLWPAMKHFVQISIIMALVCLRLILNSNFVKFNLPVICLSVTLYFCSYSQGAAVVRLNGWNGCYGQTKFHEVSLRWVSHGYAILKLVPPRMASKPLSMSYTLTCILNSADIWACFMIRNMIKIYANDMLLRYS